MTIKLLKDFTLPTKFEKRCGDGCCSWDEWEDYFYSNGEEIENAKVERSFGYDCQVDISSLTFNVDYVIVEFP